MHGADQVVRSDSAAARASDRLVPALAAIQQPIGAAVRSEDRVARAATSSSRPGEESAAGVFRVVVARGHADPALGVQPWMIRSSHLGIHECGLR